MSSVEEERVYSAASMQSRPLLENNARLPLSPLVSKASKASTAAAVTTVPSAILADLNTYLSSPNPHGRVAVAAWACLARQDVTLNGTSYHRPTEFYSELRILNTTMPAIQPAQPASYVLRSK